MELQTIRQKLQTLKASPPETVTAPWNPSRLTASSPDLAQVTTAIQALRQRSGQTLATMPQTSLQQFDAALNAVDKLAQQQQQALQRLHTLGSHLIQQVSPGTSPDIDAITQFLSECEIIEIPKIQRDINGYLQVGYHIVNFRQAEQDATSNADTLRMRSSLFKHPSNQQSERTTAFEQGSYSDNDSAGLLADFQHFWRIAYSWIKSQIYSQLKRNQRSRTSNFTFLDGAIWCTGAAITRIILNQLFLSYPGLWPLAAFLLIAGIVLSLYQSIFSSRPNPIIGYRTLMMILGLLVGGRFI